MESYISVPAASSQMRRSNGKQGATKERILLCFINKDSPYGLNFALLTVYSNSGCLYWLAI